MPAAIPIATLAISAASTAYSISRAEKERKEAARRTKELENYDRQELTNPNQDIQVSTLGADRQREDLARSMAGVAGQAAQGGSRAILGITPTLMQQQIAQNAQIASDLNQQEFARQQAIAQGNVMVQGMNEQREQQDIAGLGNAINVANFQAQNNMDNAIKVGITGIAGLTGLTGLDIDWKKDNAGTTDGKAQMPTFGGASRIYESVYPIGNQNKLGYNPFLIPLGYNQGY